MSTAAASQFRSEAQREAWRLRLEGERRRRERARVLAGYREDPRGYARDVLGAVPTEAQGEILESVVSHRRTAVKASHGIGKTYAASLLANWWYDCWEAHIVYITAPTWGQALGLTFKEIKTARRSLSLGGEVLETGLVRDEDKSAAAAHYIRAINAEQGEGIQGEHAAPLLMIFEEAVGVPRHIVEAASGLMTHPESRVLAIGNPTDEASPFGGMCASGDYRVLSYSALDHPNVAAELACAPAPYPDAVRLRWVVEMLARECDGADAPEGDAFEWWSVDAVEAALAGTPVSDASERCLYRPNASFQGRVLGAFPSVPDEQVIPRSWLQRLPVLAPVGIPQVGCDPARFGVDRTGIAERQGACLMQLVELRQMSLEAVLGKLVEVASAAAGRVGMDPLDVPVLIDTTGGLGAGPADALRAKGFRAVEDVNSSEVAVDEDTYPERRSELWFACREAARTRDLDLSRIPPDLADALVRELSTPKWQPDSKGRKKVEAKKEMKRRLGYSPDLADAANLAFAPRRHVGSVEGAGHRASYSATLVRGSHRSRRRLRMGI